MVIRYITAIVLAVTLGACASKMTPPPERPDLKCSQGILDENGGKWLLVCPPDFQALIEWENEFNVWHERWK